MWRWGTPPNFCLAFIEKQLFIKKSCWSGPLKNVRILRYEWESWWYDLQFLRYRVWQTEIDNYESFSAPLLPSLKTKKIMLRKIKKIAGDVIILRLCTKNHDHWCMLPKIWSATDIFFCYFGPFFALSPH